MSIAVRMSSAVPVKSYGNMCSSWIQTGIIHLNLFLQIPSFCFCHTNLKCPSSSAVLILCTVLLS